MKKVVLFVITIMLVSCDSAEKDVRDYIEKNAATLISLDIIEISEMDSVYNPFWDLQEAITANINIDTKILEAWNNASEHNYRTKIDFTVDSLKEAIKAVDSALLNAERVLRMKEFNIEAAPYNAVGVKAKYRINGLLKTDWFYYDGDGSIVRSTVDVEEKYNDLGEAIALREKDIKFLGSHY